MGIIRYIKSYILIFMLIPYFSCFSVYGQHDKGHYYILKKYSIENKSKLKPILDTVINQLKSSSEARYIKNGFDINVVNANDSIVILQIEALTEKYWIIDKNTSFFAYKKCLFSSERMSWFTMSLNTCNRQKKSGNLCRFKNKV